MIRQQMKSIVTNKKTLIPILAILFIPIMYAGMFLWAFWDPYAQLNELPVAVVNEDEGAQFENHQLQLGTELVTKLEDRQDFKFQSYTREEANQALENKEVYMAIEIPSSFSENATTLVTDNPKQMELIYHPNEAFNFLSSQIGETAIARIQATVNKQVTQTFTEGLYEAIDDLGDGLNKASDGSLQLQTGANDVVKGTQELKDYLDKLAQGSVILKSGTAQLTQGVQNAQNGSATLTTKLGEAAKGAQAASEGAQQLAEGAEQLNQGVLTYTTGVEQLATGANSLQQGETQFSNALDQASASSQQLVTGLGELSSSADQLASAWQQTVNQLTASLPEEQAAAIQTQIAPLIQATQGYGDKVNQATSGAQALSSGLAQLQTAQQQLEDGASHLAGGANQLNASSSQVVDGVQSLEQGSGQLASKLPELENGLQQLYQGSSTLTEGLTRAADAATQLSTGTSSLSSSSQQLVSGAGDLASGTEKLFEGTSSLHKSLAKGASEASEFTAGEASAQAVAKPVNVKKIALHEVPNYGTGFSPYFISLGLFVGALLTSIVFPLRDPASTPTSGIRWYLSKTLILVIIGVLQAIIVATLSITLVGISPMNMGMFFAGTIVTSLTFMALVQILVTVFGDAGRFVAIVLLILQLTTSAGTFPLELLPSKLQLFNQWLPMTYSVDLFKSAISIESGTGFYSSMGVLIGFITVFSFMTLIYFMNQFKKLQKI